MWSGKIKSLDVENGYIYNKSSQYADRFNDFLMMIFLNIVFQISFEKCFTVKGNTFDKGDLYINNVFRF